MSMSTLSVNVVWLRSVCVYLCKSLWYAHSLHSMFDLCISVRKCVYKSIYIYISKTTTEWERERKIKIISWQQNHWKLLEITRGRQKFHFANSFHLVKNQKSTLKFACTHTRTATTTTAPKIKSMENYQTNWSRTLCVRWLNEFLLEIFQFNRRQLLVSNNSTTWMKKNNNSNKIIIARAHTHRIYWLRLAKKVK